MKRFFQWAALIPALAIAAALTATLAIAAPSVQDDPTFTPTFTPTGFGPTQTPTATLPPPPSGGGLVTVGELAVRIAPAFNATPLGGLGYGTVVSPIGQSVNGNWVAINFNNQIGWILASLVNWAPNVDLDALPVLIPPFDATPILSTNTPTVTATVAQAQTNTPRPSDTVEPTEIVITQPAPSETPTTITEVAEVIPPPTSAPVTSVPTTMPLPSIPWGNILPFAIIGIPVALAGLFGWQFARGQREIKRYAKSFPLELCPVCQTGSLSLDETIHRSLGIAHVARTVRCHTCRSVLRQVEPGVWRYSIDHHVNPELAREFNGQQFTDNRLRDFFVQAMGYTPHLPEVDPDVMPPLTDEEILAELEAHIPPEPEPPTEDTDAVDSSGKSPPDDLPTE